MIKQIISIVALSTAFFTPTAIAGSCGSSQRDYAEYVGNKVGRYIVSKAGGGRDQRVRISSCAFNSYSNEYKIKLEIYWAGALFYDNKYNVDGLLTFRKGADTGYFSQTYANEQAKGFFGVDRSKEVAVGYDIRKKKSDATSVKGGGHKIIVENTCYGDISVGIRYLDIYDNWQTACCYKFEHGEKQGMSHGGQSVATNNSVFYYIAREEDDFEWGWKGKYIYQIGNEYLGMGKKSDTSGKSNLRFTCD